jgi:hypothetical protein
MPGQRFCADIGGHGVCGFESVIVILNEAEYIEGAS